MFQTSGQHETLWQRSTGRPLASLGEARGRCVCSPWVQSQFGTEVLFLQVVRVYKVRMKQHKVSAPCFLLSTSRTRLSETDPGRQQRRHMVTSLSLRTVGLSDCFSPEKLSLISVSPEPCDISHSGEKKMIGGHRLWFSLRVPFPTLPVSFPASWFNISGLCFSCLLLITWQAFSFVSIVWRDLNDCIN